MRKMHSIKSPFIAIIFFIAGCGQTSNLNPTQIKADATMLPIVTNTLELTLTSTPVPIFTEMHCQPSENPFAEIPEMYSYEKPFLPNIPISKICSFEGKISRGQAYSHQIAENLVFCLVPRNEGWLIVISDLLPGSCQTGSDNFSNFTSMLNPPFHGNTNSLILGHDFRNQNNTENKEGNLKRYFTFVFNREDHLITYHHFACAMWRVETECTQAAQTNINTDVTRSRSIFSITNLELGNLIPNSFAWIEYMEFKFEVYLADN